MAAAAYEDDGNISAMDDAFSSGNDPPQGMEAAQNDNPGTYMYIAVAILSHVSAILGIPVVLQKLSEARREFAVRLPAWGKECSVVIYKMATYSLQQITAGEVQVKTLDSVLKGDDAYKNAKAAIEDALRRVIFGMDPELQGIPVRTRMRQLRKVRTKDGREVVILSCAKFNKMLGRVVAVNARVDPPSPLVLKKRELDLRGRNRGEKLNDEEFEKMVLLIERMQQGLPDSTMQPLPVSERNKRVIRDKLLPVLNQEDAGESGSSSESEDEGGDDSLDQQQVVPIGESAPNPPQVPQQVFHCPSFPWCAMPLTATMLSVFLRHIGDPVFATLEGPGARVYRRVMCMLLHALRDCQNKDTCPVRRAITQGFASYVATTPTRCLNTPLAKFEDYVRFLVRYCDGDEPSPWLVTAVMEGLSQYLKATLGPQWSNASLSQLLCEEENITERQAEVLLKITKWTRFEYMNTLEAVRASGETAEIRVVLRRLHPEKMGQRANSQAFEEGLRPAAKNVDQKKAEVASVKAQLKRIDSRVNSLESPGDGASRGALEGQLCAHDRQLGIHDVRLAEMDLRFQVLETASFDGTLLWKIKDYTRRKHEAVTGRTLSLYSQHFYTSQFGYKLCARVYLNGEGIGKGKHMSLSFVVMQGDNDTSLSWPFRQKVTLMLLDQEQGRRHLSETFHPDPTSSSFKRPTSDMNIASGCPLFVSHAVVEGSPYLKDDTIVMKVIVETSDVGRQ